MIPLHRNDLTARERLLVYRLWIGQRLSQAKIKPIVIKTLLSVDGVENPIDDRAVEVMIKKFATLPGSPKRRGLRDLIETARGYNYREVSNGKFINYGDALLAQT